MINYEKAYNDLVRQVENLKPYCNNCKNRDNDNICSECDRKSFYWSFDKKCIPNIDEYEY